MKARLVFDGNTEKTYTLVFEKGDEVVKTLEEFASDHGLGAARFSAIGAFSDALLAFYDWEAKQFREIPVDEQVEVISLGGTIAMSDERPRVHVHAVLGKRDGSVVGGHLFSAHVRPNLEMTLTDAEEPLVRRDDEETGLKLIDLDVPDIAPPERGF
ncbi:MAG: PPC domain-containing DNA-binding protein [Myxococcales bacterium]